MIEAPEGVAFADGSVLSNLVLRSDDNAVFAVNVLLARGGRDRGNGEPLSRVAFDEFHHGADERGSRLSLGVRLWSAATTSWPGRGLLVLALAVVVHAAGAAVRFGAPLPGAAPARRALREHADALGRLLERAQATGEATRLLIDGTRRVCAPRAGLPAQLAIAEFVARLRVSTAGGAAELAEALDAASALASRSGVRGPDFSSVAARLAAARRRFLHG